MTPMTDDWEKQHLKKGRKSSPHYSLISQAASWSFPWQRERERREWEQVGEQICQFLASLMTDCCATGALITIKRALSHTLFLLLCLLSTAQGGIHAQTNTHTHSNRGEALISGRKEYNEWVIKTQGRITANLCPLSDHRSHDKGRISARQRRQAACTHWGDEICSIHAGQGMVHWLCLFYLSFWKNPLTRRTDSTSNRQSSYHTIYIYIYILVLDI